MNPPAKTYSRRLPQPYTGGFRGCLAWKFAAAEAASAVHDCIRSTLPAPFRTTVIEWREALKNPDTGRWDLPGPHVEWVVVLIGQKDYEAPLDGDLEVVNRLIRESGGRGMDMVMTPDLIASSDECTNEREYHE